MAFGIFHFISGGSSPHCLTGGKIPGEDSEWEAWPRAGPASWEAPPRPHGAVSDCGVSLMQEPGARVCQRLLPPDLLIAANPVSLSTISLNSCNAAMFTQNTKILTPKDDGIRRRGLWEVLKNSCKWGQYLIKGSPERGLVLLPGESTTKSLCWERALTRPCWHPDHGLPVSRAGRNKFRCLYATLSVGFHYSGLNANSLGM